MAQPIKLREEEMAIELGQRIRRLETIKRGFQFIAPKAVAKAWDGIFYREKLNEDTEIFEKEFDLRAGLLVAAVIAVGAFLPLLFIPIGLLALQRAAVAMPMYLDQEIADLDAWQTNILNPKVPEKPGAIANMLGLQLRFNTPAQPMNCAERSLREDLSSIMTAQMQGVSVIGNVRRVDGGYSVEVPPEFSRKELAAAGIDVSQITERDASARSFHTVIIPDGALPERMRQEAAFFALFDNAGVSRESLSLNKNRTVIMRDGSLALVGRAESHVLKVPSSFGNEGLKAIGIDPANVARITVGGTDILTIKGSEVDRVIASMQKDSSPRVTQARPKLG